MAKLTGFTAISYGYQVPLRVSVRRESIDALTWHSLYMNDPSTGSPWVDPETDTDGDGVYDIKYPVVASGAGVDVEVARFNTQAEAEAYIENDPDNLLG